MPDAELLDATDLDYDAYVALQRASFAELLDARGASADYLTPAFFRWKYGPPEGPARVAVVRDGDRYVAANAMFPLALRAGEVRAAGWQSCDTATHPDARGQGCFMACLHALKGSLSTDALFFGFPNDNSTRGFEKLGWTVRTPVRVWAKALALRGGDPGVATVDDLSTTELADALAASGHAMLERSAAYLAWRYDAHPIYDYTAFVTHDDGEGVAVVRRAHSMGRDLAVILELVGTTRTAERALRRAVSAWAATQGLRQLVLFDTQLTATEGLRSGFVPVWEGLLPKRQVLMGEPMGGAAARAVFDAEWRVMMGDWDAF